MAKEKTEGAAGFLYWIRLGSTRYVKIGKARNVPQRLTELQIGCPFPLHIMETTQVENMAIAEAQVHQMYKHAYERQQSRA